MSPSEFFAFLGAPLANVRWSWGSARDDGAIFLRIWQDGVEKIDGKRYAHISTLRAEGEGDDSLGYVERLGHAEKVRAGAKCYFVMCVAKDKNTRPKQIASFNKNEVFVGGQTLQRGDSLFVEIVDRVPAMRVRPRHVG